MTTPLPHRLLAVAHYLWGAALLALAAYWGYAALGIPGQMVTGTPGGNFLTALLLAASWSVPLLGVGLWLILLGHQLLHPGPGLRALIVRTHLMLLVPGLLAVGFGIIAARQAERSAAAGGGIGSPLGWLPLLLGAPMVLVSLASLLLVRDRS